ncbi:MAG TPA: DUF2092 domain-containing protein [Anaeromyxobacteraceae bacterium]|nr:DUF2092 domain-containing protein [Anaeromyxobacteraceae bacterium]
MSAVRDSGARREPAGAPLRPRSGSAFADRTRGEGTGSRGGGPRAFLALVLSIACAGARADSPAGPATKAAGPWPGEFRVLEPKAVEILKASSARLAAARTMTFTAVTGEESPSRLGPPLSYETQSLVALQRPDRLRVVTTGDGPRSELYYDGKSLSAFVPAENLLATAKAPDTIDGALRAAHEMAHIYYPFADVIVADPFGDLAPDLRLAFYVGQSHVVGGVATDVVAYATDEVFIQVWIGVDDRLPRRFRAVYVRDPLQLRHEMDLSSWQIDPKLAPDAFRLPAAALGAKPIPFGRPESRAASAKPPAPSGQAPAK